MARMTIRGENRLRRLYQGWWCRWRHWKPRMKSSSPRRSSRSSYSKSFVWSCTIFYPSKFCDNRVSVYGNVTIKKIRAVWIFWNWQLWHFRAAIVPAPFWTILKIRQLFAYREQNHNVQAGYFCRISVALSACHWLPDVFCSLFCHSLKSCTQVNGINRTNGTIAVIIKISIGNISNSR